MKQVLDFLNDLQHNNNKEWFEKNKSRYKEALSVFNDFTEKLITGISSFDPAISNLTVKDCTYRIYRDVRFSKDKSPYKTHMGAYIAPKGKKSGFSGYYFHIEASGANYIGGHMLSAGIYMPEPYVLKSIREEIMLNGKEFDEAVKSAVGFEIATQDKTKKIPSGFTADPQYIEYLKLKNHYIYKSVDDKFMLDGNLLENCIKAYSKALKYNNLINKTIEYAREQDL